MGIFGFVCLFDLLHLDTEFHCTATAFRFPEMLLPLPPGSGSHGRASPRGNLVAVLKMWRSGLIPYPILLRRPHSKWGQQAEKDAAVKGHGPDPSSDPQNIQDGTRAWRTHADDSNLERVLGASPAAVDHLFGWSACVVRVVYFFCEGTSRCCWKS